MASCFKLRCRGTTGKREGLEKKWEPGKRGGGIKKEKPTSLFFCQKLYQETRGEMP